LYANKTSARTIQKKTLREEGFQRDYFLPPFFFGAAFFLGAAFFTTFFFAAMIFYLNIFVNKKSSTSLHISIRLKLFMQNIFSTKLCITFF
jgi:hypothetical protein